jgi:hypothetical protein
MDFVVNTQALEVGPVADVLQGVEAAKTRF